MRGCHKETPEIRAFPALSVSSTSGRRCLHNNLETDLINDRHIKAAGGEINHELVPQTINECRTDTHILGVVLAVAGTRCVQLQGSKVSIAASGNHKFRPAVELGLSC